MYKLLVIALFLSGCATVKNEVKTLQTLRTDCENLQLELDTLGAKKWTKVIDKKVKDCKDHGFWTKKKRKIKTYMEDL